MYKIGLKEYHKIGLKEYHKIGLKEYHFLAVRNVQIRLFRPDHHHYLVHPNNLKTILFIFLYYNHLRQRQISINFLDNPSTAYFCKVNTSILSYSLWIIHWYKCLYVPLFEMNINFIDLSTRQTWAKWINITGSSNAMPKGFLPQEFYIKILISELPFVFLFLYWSFFLKNEWKRPSYPHF